jgi:SAM-dependent methyltransferase
MVDDFWERAAQQDPLWAILSDPSKRERRWSLEAFFETGRREISLLMYELKQLNALPRTSCALDFGCGVGRLTQALASNFREVIGVDVSPTMVRLADRLNRFGARVRYVNNSDGTLDAIATESMDFIYSNVVLHHIPPAEASARIADFLRILRPGGMTVFQLTAEPRELSDRSSLSVPMPDEAYRARIELNSPLPERLTAASPIDLVVTVANASPLDWSQEAVGSLRVGNHWLDSNGSMLVQDDGRVALPGTMASGAAVTLPLDVRAPQAPGAYICEIDVVHEGITWFADRGSHTLRRGVDLGEVDGEIRARPAAFGASVMPAHVTADLYSQLPAENLHIEGFPMYGIPMTTVLAILDASGGECFHVATDERGGPEWIGYRYFVRKLTAR